MKYDYYATPIYLIKDCLQQFSLLEPTFCFNTASFLDPSAGGCTQVKYMPYPSILSQLGANQITTLDIREDSLASLKVNYMEYYPDVQYDMVITNPPFNQALDFVATALEDCKKGGFVIMLLRLNFFGSQQRKEFFQSNMPIYVFIHSKRPKFHNAKQADKIEYAHFIWKKGHNPDFSRTYII